MIPLRTFLSQVNIICYLIFLAIFFSEHGFKRFSIFQPVVLNSTSELSFWDDIRILRNYDKSDLKLSRHLYRLFYWVNRSLIENYKFTFYHDFSSCATCNFNPHNPTTVRDDSRDVVIGFLIQRMVGLVPYVQSLRTTHSKAQIALFVDKASKEKILSQTNTFAADCGINLIEIGEYQTVQVKRYIYLVKQITTSIFLNSHQNLFNRVLISDITDVIFQGNPFYISYPDEKNTMVMSTELSMKHFGLLPNGRRIREYKILEIYGENEKGRYVNVTKYFDPSRQYYNVGVIMFHSSLALWYINEMMTALNSINRSQVDRLDQLNVRIEEQCLHNYVLYEKMLPYRKITIYDDGPNLEFFAPWKPGFNKTQIFPDFQINGSYALIYHCVYHIQHYCKSIAPKCPNIYHIHPFVRCSHIG
ncbi:hypothetical protein TRFO_23433 [Tritrichomonas foetus]|uniref:Uncharacterized protein n=1 Tax=Tritrichomonas foetus TaxID=1144522 RepID=A0A1J4KFM6_9EUKA|nr:hypothetical protein TRFO_23433 [Tritrichomonas foetus]|eukprot:OHT08149.1 hypothetical protein TRFO_23433 [Tritrichomonas foetus]